MSRETQLCGKHPHLELLYTWCYSTGENYNAFGLHKKKLVY